MSWADGGEKPRGWILPILWRGFLLIALTIGVALAVKPLAAVLRRTSALRELSIAAEHLPVGELRKPIPCARAAVTDEADRQRVYRALTVLTDAESRAKAFCLLGERDAALAAYLQAAQHGDVWSAEQAYYLQAQSGKMEAAEQSLALANIEAQDLRMFFWSLYNLSPTMDLLPVARQTVEKDPLNVEGWKLWLLEGERLSTANDYSDAIDVYRQALSAQERLGVQVGRGSFVLRIGRIDQVNVDPHQLETARAFYDQAIAWDEYLYPIDEATAHLYRGEVYAGLMPAYTDAQVIGEFNRALVIDPRNYWARLSIANVYIYNLNELQMAETYLREAIDLLPELSYAYLSLGDLYQQQGNLSAAETAYEQALARQPGWQAVIDRLAVIRKDMKKAAP